MACSTTCAFRRRAKGHLDPTTAEGEAVHKAVIHRAQLVYGVQYHLRVSVLPIFRTFNGGDPL
jgi:hypothetical protein